MVVIIDDSDTTIASQCNYNRETAAIAIDASLPTGSKTGIIRVSGSTPTIIEDGFGNPHMYNSGYLNVTLQSFQAVTQTGQPSNLSQAINEAGRHFSNNINTAKFIVLLSDGLSYTGIDSNQYGYLTNNRIKIIPFAIGNNVNGENYLKSLATNTGGTFYHLQDYSAFASGYSTLINIDIDNDIDGLPDYYESHIPIYTGGYMMTDTTLRDTDGDTLADGEEILISRQYFPMTNNVRVTAIMRSDPTEKDSDGDGILDPDDCWESNPIWSEDNPADLRYKALNPLIPNTLESLYPDIKIHNNDSNPIRISIRDNNISLIANVSFCGEKATDFFPDSNITFSNLAKQGIENCWSTTVLGSEYDFVPGMLITISTTVVVVDRNSLNKTQIPVKIEDYGTPKCKILFNWSTENVGYEIDLFRQDNREVRTYEVFSYDRFMKIAAHEFGHALGIGDAYFKNESGLKIDDNAEMKSRDIMFYSGVNYVVANEVEMMLEAFDTNKWQIYAKKNPSDLISGVIRCPQVYI